MGTITVFALKKKPKEKKGQHVPSPARSNQCDSSGDRPARRGAVEYDGETLGYFIT